jgi:hypothetical protein
MRVTIIFEEDINSDGLDQEVFITRDGVEDIYDLMSLYTQAAQAATFSYVESMGYKTRDGETYWSKL